MFVNNITISHPKAFSQEKTAALPFKRSISEKRRQVSLFDTKFGKILVSFLRKVFPHYTASTIKVFAVLIIADYQRSDPRLRWAKFYHKFYLMKHVRGRWEHDTSNQFAALAIPIKYIAAVVGCAPKTVTRSLKAIKSDGNLIVFRRHVVPKHGTYGTNHYLLCYEAILAQAVDNLSSAHNFTPRSEKVEDVLPYFSRDDLSCLHVLSSNEINTPRATPSLINVLAQQKKCPLTFLNCLIKEKENGKSTFELEKQRSKRLMSLLEGREISIKTIERVDAEGSFLTKKVFKTVCNEISSGDAAKHFSFVVRNGQFVLKPLVYARSKGLAVALRLLRRIYQRLLPHLYRISNWLGMFGRINIYFELEKDLTIDIFNINLPVTKKQYINI